MLRSSASFALLTSTCDDEQFLHELHAEGKKRKSDYEHSKPSPE
ncbi:MAG: hypothetical protein ROO71_13045 [Balneola sp.]